MSTLDRAIQPQPSQIRDYVFPEVRSIALDNGVRSLVCKAGDIPLITAHVVIDAGASTESSDKAGISRLTVSALEGGTAQLSGTELAWSLEELGLELTVWNSWDAAHARVTATTDRIGPALALLAQIVRAPAFPANEIERLREEQLAEIMQRGTDPRALGDDMALRFVFAPGSTYQRPAHGDEAHVTRLTVDDVRQFHRARYQPNTTSVMLVGDIDFERGHQLVREAFGDWNGRATSQGNVTNAPGAPNTVHIVDRPGSVQSELRIGHIGVERKHPDHFALLVANSILGGAFTSRLNMNLREKQGFTYGVRSAFAFRRGAGPFLISTAVGTDVTARAIEETFKELRALIADGVTDEETANARDYLAGVLPLQLQSTEELASRLAEIIVYDLPDDYFQDYRRHILDIDRAAADAAAREHIRLDDTVTIVTGDASKIRDDIDKLGVGTVEVVAEEEGHA